MSFVQNPRVERGKILQNSNGQYFFVCSTCDYEFITLSTFSNHQNVEHDAKDFRMISDDIGERCKKRRQTDRKAKVAKISNKLTPSVAVQTGIQHEDNAKGSSDSMDNEPAIKTKVVNMQRTVSQSDGKKFTRDVHFGGIDRKSAYQTDVQHEDKDKGSSDSMDDEPTNKTKAIYVQQTVSQTGGRRTILVSPKPKKLTRNVNFGEFGGKSKLSAIIRAQAANSGKYICKNCSGTFNTMVNLDSHESVCMLMPIRFYCNRCNEPFDDEKAMRAHQLFNHK